MRKLLFWLSAVVFLPIMAGEDETEGLVPYQQVKLDIHDMPKTAEKKDSHFQYAVYVNQESAGDEDTGVEGVYTVWLVDERWGNAVMACRTNPTAAAQWDQMKGENPDAVDVPLHLIATASEALDCYCIRSMAGSWRCE